MAGVWGSRGSAAWLQQWVLRGEAIPWPCLPDALSWGRSVPEDQVSRAMRASVWGQLGNPSQHPREFLPSVEGLEGQLNMGLIPGPRIWVVGEEWR